MIIYETFYNGWKTQTSMSISLEMPVVFVSSPACSLCLCACGLCGWSEFSAWKCNYMAPNYFHREESCI